MTQRIADKRFAPRRHATQPRILQSNPTIQFGTGHMPFFNTQRTQRL